MSINIFSIQLVFLNTDIFFFLFIIICAVFVLWARTKTYYREAVRQVVKNRWALTCSFVILLYGLTAFYDSIHFKKALYKQDGTYRTTGEGKEKEKVYGEMRSLLDSIIALFYPGVGIEGGKLKINIESSYSSPFAAKGFDKIQDKETGKWIHKRLEKPRSHWWGTDKAGGDVLYKLIKGIRTALIVGLVTTMIVIPFAIFFGVTAGYFGGKIDDTIQFIYITLGSIPSILLITGMMLIVQQKFKLKGVSNIYKDDQIVLFLCFILGIVGWSGLCRLLRAETIKLRELDYVQAAKALGVNNFIIIAKYIIPNLIHIVLISSILRFSGLVMVEAILAYIKVGVPSNIESWGRIVNGARDQLGRDPIIWWPVVGSFIFMFILVFSINILGDAVRDALDPKLRT